MRNFVVLVVLASLVLTACVSGMTEEDVRRLISEEAPTEFRDPMARKESAGKMARMGVMARKGRRAKEVSGESRENAARQAPWGPKGL